MSKSETIEALMESAIYCFSRDGYEGASLRDIARNASVPLSTIHFYFGSKTELFGAVGRRAWSEIDQDRSAYLQKAIAENPGRPPALGALIYALAYPIVSRALSKSERDIGQIFILRSHTSHWQSGMSSRMLELADRSMTRWIDALTQLYPRLTRADIVWGFSFVIGTIYSWQVIDHRYDSMLDGDGERSAEDVTADIVAFCSNGMEAIAARRTALASALSH
ncbi:hypothetical protein sos41_40910 [Alphaproteobacteria bacterium SO-S41]|nr:hypothetical protein sos41_40910 [Alphaproteobacteria bacterium SO-S41]